MYNIEIKNVGSKSYLLAIYDDNGDRVVVMFHNKNDAEICAKFIRMMRIDTVFEWVKVVNVEIK